MVPQYLSPKPQKLDFPQQAPLLQGVVPLQPYESPVTKADRQERTLEIAYSAALMVKNQAGKKSNNE